MRLQLVAPVVALMLCATLIAADIERLKSMNDLYEAAQKLESARMQVTDGRQTYAEKRTQLVYSLVRESKGAMCDRHYSQLLKTIEEFRLKAYSYVADSKKPSNWLTGLKKMVGPLGAMKNLAKFDKYLASITQRYESQSNSGILSNEDVDCDLAKLHARNLNTMMFVLQTDVKYLILEDPQVNSIAIYRQLVENKFIASSNFYDYEQLSARQRQLLLDFYAARVDTERTPIGQALDHFYEPGNLIVGRLLESCHKIADFRSIWAELEPRRAEVCAKSKSDLANESFASEFDVAKYKSIIDFCAQFLDSL